MSSSSFIDLEELRKSFKEVLDTECSLQKVHGYYDGDHSISTALKKHGTELGWFGLGVPEQFGGLGMGHAEQMILYQELGAALSPLPFLPTALGTEALVQSRNDALRNQWLPEIAAGKTLVTVAFAFPGIQIQLDKDTVVLNGTARHVVLADPDGIFILFGRDNAGKLISVLAERDSPGLKVVHTPTLDCTRTLADIECNNVILKATQVLSDDAEVIAEILSHHAALALSCDSNGGARRIIELTVDYMNTRVQFSRKLASFQSLKHRCADHKVALQASTALTDQAISLLQDDPDTASGLVSMAKFYSCDTYAHTAGDAVQLHGGIGFTWEHYCHLFLKRAKLNQFLYGDSTWHQDHAFDFLRRST